MWWSIGAEGGVPEQTDAQLRATVLRLCRALPSHDALDAEQLALIWQELLRGERPLIDCFDVAAQRYIVLGPGVARVVLHGACLQARERAALEARMRGAPLKVIAHDLQVSVATASRIVAAARRKLDAARPRVSSHQ